MIARLRTMADGGIDSDHPDTDPGTIEHFLPENPSDAWEETFDPAMWEASVYRLGNLALLEPAANRRLGNAGYRDKLKVYGRSTYALTRQIPQMAPEEWTPELLNERQSRLAARAVHLWRSDFA